MNAKERFYSGLARETIGKITSNKDNWTSFLVTMSRNYEFTYPEQVMIYAQRPNATFCKPYDEWNDEKYRRYVRRGSTGIALFVTNRDKPYLRYVFDVADTGVRRSSPELKPWEVTEENRAYVMEAMERSFGVAADGLLEAQLEEIALSLSAEYWEDYKKPILDIVANSFLPPPVGDRGDGENRSAGLYEAEAGGRNRTDLEAGLPWRFWSEGGQR